MSWRAALAAALMGALLVSTALAAEGLHVVRASGIQFTVPAGWTRVEAADDGAVEDPRTLLVVGTRGARPIESPCQVASYRVPADGAVVVVIGWKRPSTGVTLVPLPSLRLRRDTFECFDDRGGVAQVTRGGRDFQLNVMVGDRADSELAHAALAVARSFVLAPRP